MRAKEREAEMCEPLPSCEGFLCDGVERTKTLSGAKKERTFLGDPVLQLLLS